MTHEPQNDLRNGVAAEWGLASLLTGGVLVLTAMLMLHINLHIFPNPRAWSPGDVQLLRYVVAFGSLAVAWGWWSADWLATWCRFAHRHVPNGSLAGANGIPFRWRFASPC